MISAPRAPRVWLRRSRSGGSPRRSRKGGNFANAPRVHPARRTAARDFAEDIVRALFSSAALAAIMLVSACGMGGPTYPQFGQAAYRIDGTATSPGGAPVQTTMYRD